MKYIEITAGSNRFDMKRLSESGGHIGFKKNGTPVFRFNDHKQYQKYLELNNRKEIVK
jgi:hypothetical protein